MHLYFDTSFSKMWEVNEGRIHSECVGQIMHVISLHSKTRLTLKVGLHNYVTLGGVGGWVPANVTLRHGVGGSKTVIFSVT